MSRVLNAATVYYLSYFDKSSMLFITGQGGQRSSVRTNLGLRYTCNSAYQFDLSYDDFVDAYYSHPAGSPVTLILELEQWDDASSKVHKDMELEIARLCEDILRVNSAAEWAKAVLKKFREIGLIDFSLQQLKAKEEEALSAYKGPGTETFVKACEL